MGIINDLSNAVQASRNGSSSSTNWAEARAYNTAAMQEAMAFNRKEAQKNREWQEKMSNTAYQRAVKDMEKAGINPILRYTQGGASTPGGASASSGMSSIGRDAYSSSYGVAGLMEGFGQMVGRLENLGLSTGKTENIIVSMYESVKETVSDTLGLNHSSKPTSRSGGFGGSSSGGSFKNTASSRTGGFGGAAKGGSLSGTSSTSSKVYSAVKNLWG